MATKIVKGRRFWAVGFKGWVELRAHPTPPKAIRSVLEYEKMGRGQPVFDEHGYYHFEPTGPYKREIRTTVYDGGQVIRTVSTNKFYRLTKKHVGCGMMVEVTPAMAAAVKASKGYGYDRR